MDLLEKVLKAMLKVQSAQEPRFETMGQHDDLVLALFKARMRVLPVDGELVRRRCGLFLVRFHTSRPTARIKPMALLWVTTPGCIL